MKAKRKRSTELAAATGSEKPFTERLEDMDRYELMRRCTNQASTIAAYQQCLDGLKLREQLQSGGMDNHRRPEDIRDIVERLLSPNDKLSHAAGQKGPNANVQ
jgi:hypothetical protein